MKRYRLITFNYKGTTESRTSSWIVAKLFLIFNNTGEVDDTQAHVYYNAMGNRIKYNNKETKDEIKRILIAKRNYV